jgi:hypothetical protein
VYAAADERYGTVLNVQRGTAMRFECHVDSNPVTGLLFCTIMAPWLPPSSTSTSTATGRTGSAVCCRRRSHQCGQRRRQRDTTPSARVVVLVTVVQ